MIASAMTPEPIVATVRFDSGDMRASIGAQYRPDEGHFRAELRRLSRRRRGRGT